MAASDCANSVTVAKAMCEREREREGGEKEHEKKPERERGPELLDHSARAVPAV